MSDEHDALLARLRELDLEESCRECRWVGIISDPVIRWKCRNGHSWVPDESGQLVRERELLERLIAQRGDQ